MLILVNCKVWNRPVSKTNAILLSCVDSINLLEILCVMHVVRFSDTIASSSYVLMCEILILFIVFLHVLFRPYKVLWHNLLESAIFIILLFINTMTIFNFITTLWRDFAILNGIRYLVWLQVLTIFFPLIYLAGYTIVSAYRNIKLFMKGYQGVATTPDASHTDSMGFPARLMDM